MPEYTFRCRKCGEAVPYVLPVDSPRPQQCGHCGGELYRVYDAPNVTYHGSGFYSTDKALYDHDDE